MRAIKYSPREKRVLGIVRSEKRINTTKLTEMVYGDEKPFYARQSILSIVGTLARKALELKEPFKVMRTQRKGPQPIEVWIEEKKE